MIKKLIPKSKYARNVLTLMTGTGLAQALPIAVTPILTRIYSPEDFGVFALFTAICAILTVLVTGRYELAVIVPKEDSEARSLVYLSISLAFIVSLALFLIMLVFGQDIAYLLNKPELSKLLYWVPLTTFLLGSFQALSYWNNRKSQYRIMASSRILQSGSVSGTQLTAGFFKLGQIGLVIGQIIGQLISFIFLLLAFRKTRNEYKTSFSKEKIIAVAKKYKRFPQYLILAHGFNTGSSQAPAILLNSLFTSAASGYFMLTQRVLQAPISLIASAISDVFRQEASSQYAHTKECKTIYLATLKKLVLLSILPFVILFIFSEEIFVLAFGAQWAVAGEYARILTPMFFMRFVTSPLSAMFTIAERQQLDLAWQAMLFITVVSAFLIGYSFESVQIAMIGFSSAYVGMFLLNLFWSYGLAKGE